MHWLRRVFLLLAKGQWRSEIQLGLKLEAVGQGSESAEIRARVSGKQPGYSGDGTMDFTPRSLQPPPRNYPIKTPKDS